MFRPPKFFFEPGMCQEWVSNDEKYAFLDVASAILLTIETNPADDCFQGLLMVHEDRLQLTWSGVSSAEVLFSS